jgi:flagellar protein FlbD
VISLHKLCGDPITINAELILTVESTPDTLVTTVDRRRFMVTEPVGDVIAAVLDYRRHVWGGAPVPHGAYIS